MSHLRRTIRTDRTDDAHDGAAAHHSSTCLQLEMPWLAADAIAFNAGVAAPWQLRHLPEERLMPANQCPRGICHCHPHHWTWRKSRNTRVCRRMGKCIARLTTEFPFLARRVVTIAGLVAKPPMADIPHQTRATYCPPQRREYSAIHRPVSDSCHNLETTSKKAVKQGTRHSSPFRASPLWLSN